MHLLKEKTLICYRKRRLQEVRDLFAVRDYETPVKTAGGLCYFVLEGPDDAVIFASLWKYKRFSDLHLTLHCAELEKPRLLDWLITNGHSDREDLEYAFCTYRTKIGQCSDVYKRIIEATNWEPTDGFPSNDDQWRFWKKRQLARTNAAVVLFIGKQVGIWRDVSQMIARCVWGARGYYEPEQRLKKKRF